MLAFPPLRALSRTATNASESMHRLHSLHTCSAVLRANRRGHRLAGNVESPAAYAYLVCSSTPKRRFWSGLPSILVPPVVFTSLLVGLWTYKCAMTVLFQDKIIYMPYMPPYARKEKVEDYAAICRPVIWQHVHIQSMDGTKIALCVGRSPSDEVLVAKSRKKKVVICYFQGNGSSTPPRLPLLSNTLKVIEARARAEGYSLSAEFVMVALSYRGYWTSKGRASQKGIEDDAQAMLKWVAATQASPNAQLQVILWGQSIGAGVAATAASRYLSADPSEHSFKITALVLETPFTSIKSMLLALYPQKWLPYQYLWPFLWNHWDSPTALRSIARAECAPRVLLMPATRDEVVPPGEADKLEQVSRAAGLATQRIDIIGALHTEATTRREGQVAVADFVVESIKKA